jgi:hypothetical protein
MEPVSTSWPEEMEPAAAPAPPKFAELAETPAHTPPPRDYAPEFSSGVRRRVGPDERRDQPDAMLFPETDKEMQPDLEKPTFLRNLRL